MFVQSGLRERCGRLKTWEEPMEVLALGTGVGIVGLIVIVLIVVLILRLL